MKKLFLLMLPMALFFTQISLPVVATESDGNIGSVSMKLLEERQVRKQNESQFKLNSYDEVFLSTEQERETKETVKWSNKYFPTVFSEDVDYIQSVNKKLRTKYMNKSELYQPIDDLTFIDGSFVTQTTEEVVLYANLTPEDFGINSKYFVSNSEEVYNSMLKETLYGIDHGYLLGSLTKKEMDHSKNEYIQLSLILPKGSKMVRIGSLTDAEYIIPRESTFKYVGKNFNKESKNVTISAQMIDRSELNKEARAEETSIESTMNSLYDVPTDFVELTPLGLNAGYVLEEGINVISKAFESLADGGILSKILLEKDYFHLTNGFIIHTDVFDRETEGKSLEERRKIFEEFFKEKELPLGSTQPWTDGTSDSSITFAHLYEIDPLPQVSITDDLAATLLHESFHALINSTNFFEDRPLFQGDSNLFIDMIEMLRKEEVVELITLLKSNYADTMWDEFICEAFMAKFHPNTEIKQGFNKVVPQTNRFLDNLFDQDPPTTPNNLKELEVGGTSVKLTFDHSIDNVSVDMYNIYQNGNFVKSVITDKDADGLSYPDPGNHQSNLEVTIDNLEQLTDYEFQVTAVDEAQNESVKSTLLKIKTKDIEPPKLKGSLRGQALVSNAARFNWPHPTDNDKVKEVRLYRSETSSILFNNDMTSLLGDEKYFVISGNENYYTDTTIVKGKAYTYYMVAIDEAGNESEKSNQITIKTEDSDDEKKNQDKAEDVKYSEATLNWSGAFDGLGAAGFNIFSWFKGASGWVFGSVASVAGDVVSSVVDLSPGMSNQFVVVPVDSEGNPLADGIQISVDSIDRSSIQAKDSTLYTGQKWNKADNFVCATDEDGNEVTYDDARVSTNVEDIDTSHPGEYEIKYSYKGLAKTSESTFKVTVKQDQTTLELQDVTLFVGQTFDPNSIFKNVVDKDGNKLKPEDVYWYLDTNWIGKGIELDTSKVGDHWVEILFPNANGDEVYSNFCKITVKEDPTTLELQDVTLFVGQTFDPNSPFKNVVDKDGNKITAENVYWYYVDEVRTKELDTSKPGVHSVRIVYLDGYGKWKYSDSCKVTVLDKEVWISDIKDAHKRNYHWVKGDNLDAYTGIVFDNNIKEVMKDQLDSYRVTYNGPDGQFNESKKASGFDPNGAVKVDFYEYNNGRGIRVDNTSDLEIYAVVKTGDEIKVYDHNEQKDWFSQIEDAHKTNISWQEDSIPGRFAAIGFKNDIQKVMNNQLASYRVIYTSSDKQFDTSKNIGDFDSNGAIKVDFHEYNNGQGITLDDTSNLEIYAVLKNGYEIRVYNQEENKEWYSNIAEAHQTNYNFSLAGRDNSYDGLYFGNNIRDVMKDQLASYRMVYKGPDGEFDVTREASYFYTNGEIQITFLTYTDRYNGLVIDETSNLEIYAVLKNGYQVKIYNHEDQKKWHAEIAKAHETNLTWQKGTRPDGFTAVTFENNIKEVTKDQLRDYRVVYKNGSNSFDATIKAYAFNPNGSVKVNFTEYNNGHGIIVNSKTQLDIYMVLKNNYSFKVYSYEK